MELSSSLSSKFSICQSDSSNASCDSGVDDHHTLLSMCESSNVTSMDEISGLSQNSAQHQPHFKVPRLANWGNLESASTSNACSGISSSTCINDEETSDQTIAPEDQLQTAKKKSEDLNQIQALLKAIIKNASGANSSSILDTMTLKDLKSELNMATDSPELHVSACKEFTEGPCTNFSLALSDSICSGSDMPEETATNSQPMHMLDFSLYSTYPSKLQKLDLKIICQPETQHRARYMTEGSRGAVKDRSGNGFPTLKLFGYKGEESVTLQVFIGSDSGNPAPHLFYQASKVCNKNSPPCTHRTIQGTVVIELELPPQNDMTFVVDCVGILKERNVDVEQRIQRLKECGAVHKTPAALKVFKKRSTKCRLVFRAIIHSKTSSDFRTTKPTILQVSSGPILCTQPQGVPEICRQSLTDCLCNGGSELFIIGKNFLKDTKVVFKDWTNNTRGQTFNCSTIWQDTITPDKDYLQPNHLICKIPPHARASSLKIPMKIQFFVQSGGKKSDVHYLTFHPVDSHFGSLFSGNNIESRLLGSTSQNHQAESGVFNSDDVKVIHGVKVVNSKPGESSQPPVYIILPGGTSSNVQNQILPVVSPTPITSVGQSQDTKGLNNISSPESQAISKVGKMSNGGQSQPVQLMLVPQSFAVPVTNQNNQTEQKEPFTIKNLLLQEENFASNSSINHSMGTKDSSCDIAFQEETSNLRLVTPLLTLAPNQTMSNLPTNENLKEKYEETLNSQTMSEGVTQASLRQLNELQKQLKQDSLIQTIPNEYDSNKIQDFQSQHIQQNQQINQVLQSQAQQIHHEQQKQLIERELEMQRDQQRLQQVKKKMEEEHILFQREIQQIQQDRQLSLEIDLNQADQSQQQQLQHMPVCQNLHQEHCIPHKIQLEFEKKLSPAEKLQLENGLQQIQQEQLHQELQNHILEQKSQLHSNLQRFQQEQQIQEIQQAQQKCIEEEIFIQQSLNKNSNLQYQVTDNSLLKSSLTSTSLAISSDVNNESLWQNTTSGFQNSISAGTKLENNYFYIDKTGKTLSDGANHKFTSSNINTRQTNYGSQMDTSFGNQGSSLKPIIFDPAFQVNSAQLNDLKADAQTTQVSFSSASTCSSNSDAFHNTSLIRNACNDIESMDISTPSSLCKAGSQVIATTSHIVTTPVFRTTASSLHVLTDTNILPMSMETNLPPPLPVLNAAETQFLNSAENLFSRNMLTNSSSGRVPNKPVHVDPNLTILTSDIFESNILESNRQVALINVEEMANPGKLIPSQENFLHSPVIHGESVPSLMILGQNIDQKSDQNIKPPLMDVVVSQSDKMDISIGSASLQSHSKDTSNSQAQLMNILQTETEMMKLFHN